MKPPLHDVALHHHQRTNLLAWLKPQRWPNVSATTLIALGIYTSVCQPSAQASPIQPAHSESLPSETAVQPQESVALSDPESDEIAENQNSVEAEQLQSSENERLNFLEYKSDSYSGSTHESIGNFTVAKLDTVSLTQLHEFDDLSENAVIEDGADVARTDQDSQLVADSPATAVTTAPIAQASTEPAAESTDVPSNPEAIEDDPENQTPVSRSSRDLGEPLVQVQGIYTLQGNESSARLRVSASYPITPNVLIGGSVDLTTGDAFSDSPEQGLDLNELYVAVSPTEIPSLRFVVGMLDLTSYFDRNSFAKDAATQFFNPVFQTNPALAAAGLGSRPAILMNWTVADPLEIKVAGFSSDRDLNDFAIDGVAGEVALRLDNFIIRGTYITDRDAGQNDGFQEIYGLPRGSDFGIDSDDREVAYGVNAEYFIPEIKLGLFGRYGWYENVDLDQGGTTFSLGFNLLDIFMPDDRLGLAYGRELSSDTLRADDEDYPDVWELFYDFRITPNLRAGVTLQAFDQFSETIAGFRIRADFDSSDFGRLFR